MENGTRTSWLPFAPSHLLRRSQGNWRSLQVFGKSRSWWIDLKKPKQVVARSTTTDHPNQESPIYKRRWHNVHNIKKNPKTGPVWINDRLGFGSLLQTNSSSVQHVQNQETQHWWQDWLLTKKEPELIWFDSGDFVSFVKAWRIRCIYQH